MSKNSGFVSGGLRWVLFSKMNPPKNLTPKLGICLQRPPAVFVSNKKTTSFGFVSGRPPMWESPRLPG